MFDYTRTQFAIFAAFTFCLAFYVAYSFGMTWEPMQ